MKKRFLNRLLPIKTIRKITLSASIVSPIIAFFIWSLSWTSEAGAFTSLEEFAGSESVLESERVQPFLDSIYCRLSEYALLTEEGNYIVNCDYKGEHYTFEIEQPKVSYQYQPHFFGGDIYISIQGKLNNLLPQQSTIFNRIISIFKSLHRPEYKDLNFPTEIAKYNPFNKELKITHRAELNFYKHSDAIKSVSYPYVFGIHKDYIIKPKKRVRC